METTILQIKQKLLNYFLTESVICPKKHIHVFDYQCDPEELKENLLIVALEDLETQGIVKKFQAANNTWWALTKPLAMYEQTVPINFQTAIEMSQVINEYCEGFKNQSELCDHLNIQEKDLQKMIIIIENLLAQTKEA